MLAARLSVGMTINWIAGYRSLTKYQALAAILLVGQSLTESARFELGRLAASRDWLFLWFAPGVIGRASRDAAKLHSRNEY